MSSSISNTAFGPGHYSSAHEAQAEAQNHLLVKGEPEAEAAPAPVPEMGSMAYARSTTPVLSGDARHLFGVYDALPAQDRPQDQSIDLSGMSPDMILQYVQMRLTDIDGQIQDLQGDAETRKKQSDDLRTFQNAVRSLVGIGGGAGYDSTANDKADDGARAQANIDADKRLADAMKTLEGNPTLSGKLQDLRNEIFRGGDQGSKIDAQTLQNDLDWAKDQLTSLNSDNELTMMRLNALIQLRSQVISSASNEQASINEGMKTVIGNMRA